MEGDHVVATVLGCELGLDAAAVPFAGEPIQLEGGRSASTYRCRLAEGPPDLGGRDLVLRLLPRHAPSLAEAAIQQAVTELGYPAPAVARYGSIGATRYVIMAFVEGPPLFDARRPFSSARTVPGQLATLMLSLHALDPAPAARALGDVGAPEALDARERTLGEARRSWAAIEVTVPT
jgi:hypothetical protein